MNLNTFFKEKEIESKTFEIQHNGITHFVDSGFVIDLIKKTTGTERAGIKKILMQIDFHNGNIHHFLRHLAEGYVARHF